MNDKSSKTAEKEKDDIDEIVAEERFIDVEGVRCRVSRLKTKQVIALIRLIKKMSSNELGKDEDITAIMTDTSRLLNVLLLSLDTAEDELHKFLLSFLKIPNEKHEELTAQIMEEGIDPIVMVDIFEIFVEQEGGSFKDLLKKVRGLVEKIGKMVPENLRKLFKTPGPSSST